MVGDIVSSPSRVDRPGFYKWLKNCRHGCYRDGWCSEVVDLDYSQGHHLLSRRSQRAPFSITYHLGELPGVEAGGCFSPPPPPPPEVVGGLLELLLLLLSANAGAMADNDSRAAKSAPSATRIGLA